MSSRLPIFALHNFARSRCRALFGLLFGPVIAFSVITLSVITLTGCGGGGGGGGDSFIGAALLSVSATPSEIDAGDRTRVTVNIAHVHPDGIALKLKFPDGLKYVIESSNLFVNGNKSDTAPAVNASKDGFVYLVYFFTKARFGENNEGELQIELEGVTGISDGEIEVDADVDDPLISNSSEFSIDNPEFQTQDIAQIRVRG